MLLIFWLSRIKRFYQTPHIGLALSWAQIGLLLVSEIMLFACLYLNYHLSFETDTADSFAWHNMFLYARGVLPIVAFAQLSDGKFRFTNDPTWQCLLAILIIDYVVLFIATKLWTSNK